MNAFQNIVKLQFSHIGGLQNTLFQKSTPLQYDKMQMVLQVLYVNSGHWSCLRVQQGEVFL